MEIQKPLNSQSNLKPQIAKAILRKNGTGGINLPDFSSDFQGML